MRILLINPWIGEVFPPPSLGYIQAVLKRLQNVEVIAMDIDLAMNEPDDYDMVAVSFHSFSVKYAERLREKFKKSWMICGGHHPSALPQQMLSIGYNQVCIGEGENAIEDIIKGNKESIIVGRPILDINSISFPDYTGFRGNWSMGIPIISSRGCPFSCTFCASSLFWNKKWKMRSADNVLNEIDHHKIKTFMFEDDNFTVNRKRVFDICDGLESMNVSWQCASRAETLQDEELVMKLKKAGCYKIWLGVETLSQDSLDRCDKRTTVDKMLNGISIAEKYGITTMSQFISGLPGDTLDDINITVSNIKRSKIREKGANIIWLLPNTDIYRSAKDKGFSDDIYLKSGAPFYTYEQNINTLQYWSNLINNA